jgi:hypothetical protein
VQDQAEHQDQVGASGTSGIKWKCRDRRKLTAGTSDLAWRRIKWC